MDNARAAEIDTSLKRLHGSHNARQLSGLHEEAASMMADADAQRFHLTHAWVYALVEGREDRIAALETRLQNADGLATPP
ncbi:MAG: hypothetical protein AAFQ36_03750 [Pseudomonadota bacterium]